MGRACILLENTPTQNDPARQLAKQAREHDLPTS
jgi:hypothetical protein